MYGYCIENGVVAVCEEEASKIRQIYENYLSGMSLKRAAEAAGVSMCHTSVKQLLQNPHLLGDDIYPVIVDKETYSAFQTERKRREIIFGRDKRVKKNREVPRAPIHFRLKEILPSNVEQSNDPYRQAEYVYGLIESEHLDNRCE